MFNIEFLSGSWSFRRIITNHLDSRSSGIVTGAASFVPVANQTNQLQYVEHGSFNIATGLTITISNEYFYVLDSSNKKIAKHAGKNGAIGNLLYYLQNNNTAEHLCGNDRYVARYEFSPEKSREFAVNYCVSGPRKNYSSCAKYIKIT